MLSENVVYIYSLNCPFTNVPKYIGKSKNIKSRFRDHLYNCTRQNNKNYNWIKSLLDQNTKPILECLACVRESEWEFWERHYISLYRSWGFDLKNGTLGGDGIGEITNEVRERCSKNRKSKKNSPESYLKVSESLKLAYREGRRKDRTGTKATEESKRKVSIALKEKWTKPVIQYNLNGDFVKEFKSLTDAAKEIGCCIGMISMVINDKRDTVKGFRFQYNYNKEIIVHNLN